MTAATFAPIDPHRDPDLALLQKVAAQTLRDVRIRNYFDRELVVERDVLDILRSDGIYEECLVSDAFDTFAESRADVDQLRILSSQAWVSGALNWRTVLFLITVVTCLAICIGLVDMQGSVLSAQTVRLTVLGSAITAAFLGGIMIRYRQRPLLAAVSVVTLTSVALALPAIFVLLDNLTWNLTAPYVSIVLALTAGALVSSSSTEHEVRLLAQVGHQALVCCMDYPLRREHKRRWLEESSSNLLYSHTVLAINRLLGEDSTKLLVEQDSEGLRRLQDPALVVPTHSEAQLRVLIRRMDGGSIAVTGPRGAGKSTLLRRFCESETPKPKPKRRRTATRGALKIYIPAPAEYIAREFLAELFRQICDAYLQRHDSSVPGMRYRRMRTRRDRLRAVRAALLKLRLTVQILWVLALLAVAFVPAHVSSPDPTQWVSSLLNQWPDGLNDDVLRTWHEERYPIRMVAIVLAVIFLPRPWVWGPRLRSVRRSTLVKRARNYSIHLKIERTSTFAATVALPNVRGTGLSSGTSDKYVPWSLPELVSKLREFMVDITNEPHSETSRLIIGIDEIDRIGSVDQAERFIGEIKTVFGMPNCFFLVSVAEDVGFLFSRRSIVGRSTLEHSFDDVVVVDPLELDEARQLLSTRVPGFTESFVILALALSGGLPREMISVARRLVDSNQTRSNFRIGDLAFRLVRESMAEVIRTSRNQLARLTLTDAWSDIFFLLHNTLARLRNADVPAAEQRDLIRVLCQVRPPAAARTGEDEKIAAKDDDISAGKIVAGLSAFSCYGLTVVEAFDNDYFNLSRASASISDPSGGSYTELASARLELGISPEASQTIIQRFRAASGLAPLTAAAPSTPIPQQQSSR